MKQATLLLCLMLCLFSAQAQNRNNAVKALNQYMLYSDANIQALSASITSLDRYNGLFNSYLRNNRLLGGEPYEAPKRSPFVDEDVFNLGEDDPATLYKLAIKGSAILPATLRTTLNAHLDSIKLCSQNIVKLVDSMSNIFHGPIITVTNHPDSLPYRLLHQSNRQLQLSKKYRDQLFAEINHYYSTTYAISAPSGDYIHSVEPLKKGMELVQNMLNDLFDNDSSNIAQYVYSLDSLYAYLDDAELHLLKGIQPFGNSRFFPNKSYYSGTDLYSKYEDIMGNIRLFAKLGRQFLDAPADKHYPAGKCLTYHQDLSSRFNSVVGLLYYYNEYVLLIGGGKFKVLSDTPKGSKYIYKGWGDESHTLPIRTLLLWMKETPQFQVLGIDKI
jgi:hypothetical protein